MTQDTILGNNNPTHGDHDPGHKMGVINGFKE